MYLWIIISYDLCFFFLIGGEVSKPRFAQFFHGSLASLTIRPGKIESQKVISCLQACKEGLDINSLESLGQGLKVRDELTSFLITFKADLWSEEHKVEYKCIPRSHLICHEVMQGSSWAEEELCGAECLHFCLYKPIGTKCAMGVS